jgi:sulfopyruvate decarboxylase alpha subunit
MNVQATQKPGATSAPAVPDWYHGVYAKLREAQIEYFCYVPDAGLDPLIRMAHDDQSVRSVVLTTEEEGVGVCTGISLSGKRGVLMMQSSGVGNCINTFSLITNCRIPFLLLVTMRGEFGEAVQWQVPMGKITEDCLKLCGFTVYRAERPDEAAYLVDGAAKIAWRSDERAAVLLTQRLIGPKEL